MSIHVHFHFVVLYTARQANVQHGPRHNVRTHVWTVICLKNEDTSCTAELAMHAMFRDMRHCCMHGRLQNRSKSHLYNVAEIFIQKSLQLAIPLGFLQPIDDVLHRLVMLGIFGRCTEGRKSGRESSQKGCIKVVLKL